MKPKPSNCDPFELNDNNQCIFPLCDCGEVIDARTVRTPSNDHILQLMDISSKEANDFHELLNSEDMYETPEQTIAALKETIDRLWDSNLKLKEENAELKRQLLSALPGLQNLQNNY